MQGQAECLSSKLVGFDCFCESRTLEMQLAKNGEELDEGTNTQRYYVGNK